jgi:hypothetical protein
MNDQYFWNPTAARDPDLRAADADRERIAEQLRESHAEGRLDIAEFQERLERAYEAKTLGELDRLVMDLPRRDQQEERRSYAWAPLRLASLVVPVALIAAIVVAAHFATLVVALLLFFVVRPLAWRSWGGGHARAFRGCGPRRMTRL